MARRKIAKPTKEQKKLIDFRLRQKYPQMFKPGYGKVNKEGLLTSYAKQAGGYSTAGAHGADKEAIEKILNKGKKKK